MKRTTDEYHLALYIQSITLSVGTLRHLAIAVAQSPRARLSAALGGALRFLSAPAGGGGGVGACRVRR